MSKISFSCCRKLIFCIVTIHLTIALVAQSESDTIAQQPITKSADDPSQFLTRVEVFNEYQHYDKAGGFSLNQTVIRTIIKIGKRFTTRIDIPFVSNSFAYPQGYDKVGLGDISFRLLGYNIKETKRSAVTASIEISLNTAASNALGTGKNMLIPLLAYTTLLKDNKTLVALSFQQVNSVSGDELREEVSFTKLQGIVLHYWSKRAWTVVAPELFIDYIHGGTSMLLKGRMVYAPNPRTNIWIQANAGLYGDFATRYNWGAEAGCRYFLLRKMNFTPTKKN
ncbi:MAG: hypothetical protein KA479_14310 [Saprospiraceae bacterium]|nr:hypothetical protein [Saprospiraceae bacterium]MBP6681521.1 hypothetical protein [Saprospiraceae bacterium]